MSQTQAQPPTAVPLPAGVTLDSGEGELPRLSIKTTLASAEIYLHGAHVTHYQPTGEKSILFLSKDSVFKPGKAIRGGVPIIFPWFGPNKENAKLPAHGFARTQPWVLSAVAVANDGRVVIELALEPNEQTRAVWPHAFALRFRIDIGAVLRLTLIVRNTGADAFLFEEALHTYLNTDDIHTTRVEGLTGRVFIDQLQSNERLKQSAEPITFTQETDRIYLGTPDTAEIHDTRGKRLITIEKEHSLATVVWNPWINKSKAMADFGDEEWPGMLCIESANCADARVTLAPGAQHEMTAIISARSST